MAKSLIGFRVSIRGNDFFVQDVPAKIVEVDEKNKKLLIELNKPLVTKGVSYSRAVASPRLSNAGVDLLLVDGVLECSVIWIPDEKFNGSKPMDLSWWRGGAAAVTDLFSTKC